MENELNSTSVDVPDGFIDSLKSDPMRSIFTDEALAVIMGDYSRTPEYESDRSNLYDQLCANARQYNVGTVIMATVGLLTIIIKEEMDGASSGSISLFTDSMLFFYIQLIMKCDTSTTIVDSLIGTFGKMINGQRKVVAIPVLVNFLIIFVKISFEIND
jgi:hypothetical protein